MTNIVRSVLRIRLSQLSRQIDTEYSKNMKIFPYVCHTIKRTRILLFQCCLNSFPYFEETSSFGVSETEGKNDSKFFLRKIEKLKFCSYFDVFVFFVNQREVREGRKKNAHYLINVYFLSTFHKYVYFLPNINVYVISFVNRLLYLKKKKTKAKNSKVSAITSYSQFIWTEQQVNKKKKYYQNFLICWCILMDVFEDFARLA